MAAVTSQAITREILQESIANELQVSRENVQVMSFDVGEGCKKGDGLLCDVKAVTVQAKVLGQERVFEYMAKIMPTGTRRQTIEGLRVFETECQAYGKIIPALLKLQKEDVTIAAPRCFYASNDTEIIIMENLKHQGFQMADVKKGLDLEHIKLVLKKIASFHALSYHFLQTYPSGLDQFKVDFPLVNTNHIFYFPNEEALADYVDLIATGYQGAISIIENLDDNGKTKAERMRNFLPKIREEMRETTRVKGKFAVIAHNDCRMTNFLFKYKNNGDLEAMKMVDFQLLRRTRPSVDLLYCFGTSTDPVFINQRLDGLLEFYHSNLLLDLVSLGYGMSVYPFKEFRQEFDDTFAFGHIFGIFLSQVMLSEMTEAGEAVDEDVFQIRHDKEGFAAAAVKSAERSKVLLHRVIGLVDDAIKRGIL